MTERTKKQIESLSEIERIILFFIFDKCCRDLYTSVTMNLRELQSKTNASESEVLKAIINLETNEIIFKIECYNVRKFWFELAIIDSDIYKQILRSRDDKHFLREIDNEITIDVMKDRHEIVIVYDLEDIIAKTKSHFVKFLESTRNDHEIVAETNICDFNKRVVTMLHSYDEKLAFELSIFSLDKVKSNYLEEDPLHLENNLSLSYAIEAHAAAVSLITTNQVKFISL